MPAALTPDDLVELELPDGVRPYELSDVELVAMGHAVCRFDVPEGGPLAHPRRGVGFE